MKIAIVNDLLIAVEALKRVLKTVPGYTIAWVAYNGAEAVEKNRKDTPDLILMDLIMPVMDGVEATRKIMQESPCAILVVTATVEGNAAKVFEAMGYGALDAVCTPVIGTSGKVDGAEELLKKIFTIGKLVGKETIEIEIPSSQKTITLPFSLPPLIAIGSSTGGPRVLSEILSVLPAKLGASIVIIQHVDDKFADELAAWLDKLAGLKVMIAGNGMYPEQNVVFLAGKNEHLEIGADFAFHYTPEPRGNPYCPSVDSLFLSLSRYWPRKDMAILLTGMGRDGARGLLDLKKNGWFTVAQDEKSSVVYGMPKAAAELGAALEILPCGKIPEAIIKHLNKIRK